MSRVAKDGPAAPLPVLAVLAVLAALAAVGLALFLLATATRWGAGVGPDGVAYLETARQLAAGASAAPDADAPPLGDRPPLYPAVLAAAGATGADAPAAARGIGMLLLVANSVWVALAVRLVGVGGWAFPALAAAVFALSPNVLWLHGWALSEPLFLLTGGVGLLALAGFLERGRVALLALSVTCVALACLDRYAGLAVVAAGSIALLLAREGPLARRAAVAGGFALASGLPLAIWWLGAPAAGARRLALHPMDPFEIERGAGELARWLLLGWLPPAIFAFVVLAAAAIGVGLWRRRRAPGSGTRRAAGAVVGVSFCLAYVAFLVASISLFDAHTRLNRRILAPLYPVFVVAAVAALARVERLRPFGVTAIAGVFLLAHAVSSAGWAARARDEGLVPGYQTPAWRRSATLAGIRRLPEDAILYSNAPDAIRFHTGRSARWLPQKWDPLEHRRRDDFPEQLARLRRDVEQHGARIAWFDALAWRSYLMGRSDLALLPLRDVGSYDDGALYEAR